MTNLKPYVAYIKSTLRLTIRDRVVLFFSYLFPLVFFFAFGEGFGAAQSVGIASQVVNMVLVLGVLGNGFFGAGIRATMERELGILRRFKVAPITAAPVIVSSVVTGWVLYMPAVLLFFVMARLRYGMPFPRNIVSLLLVLSLGVVAFRAMGLILSAVANSMAESQIITQLLYFPMLMLSGATFPLTSLPEWLQVVAQFLPATHLYLGMQGIMVRNETAWDHLVAMLALTLTLIVGVFISVKLFRWEKDEKLKPQAKLWVAAALLPFIVLGAWQTWSRTNLVKTTLIAREQRRGMNWLIRDARIFTGTGKVIESGAVFVRNGRIERVFDGVSPDAKELRAEHIEASGRTLLPGFIDTMIVVTDASDAAIKRALAEELFCGITGVGLAAPNPSAADAILPKLKSGEILASDALRITPIPPQMPVPLVAAEWASEWKSSTLLGRSLTQQMMRPEEIARLKQKLADAAPPPVSSALAAPMSLGGWHSLPYGASFHRQLQLMVRQGMTPPAVLAAATSGAAQQMGHPGLGVIQPGAPADMVLVDGNPLDDISATERIVAVFYKGERLARSDLIDDQR